MEIERKFLIDAFPAHLPLLRRAQVEQGYLSTAPTVRIRKRAWDGGKTDYMLCIKGKGTLIRQEVEVALTEEQYTDLCGLLCGAPIRKDFREYLLPDGMHLECSLVDEGAPTCFMYAEIEFDSLEQAQSYPAPDCVGRDVTAGGYGMAGYWKKTRA